MSQEYAPAKWIGTSHFWAGRSGYTPKWLIVHGTAGGASAEDVGYYFQANDPPTSTHYVVGLNGEVVQCVAEGDTAWGNGIVTDGHDPWWSPNLNPNFLTFSVEHVKPSPDNSDTLTPAQKAASFALIKHLCEQHNIPMRRADANGGITGHSSIDPISRSFCPGPYPWDELIAYLNQGARGGAGGVANATSASGAANSPSSANSASAASANGANVGSQSDPPGTPTGWHDDGQSLIAPNGERVNLGFRWYILNHSWQADNWPLEPEQYAEPLDVTSPNLGAGTVQYFRQSILAWRENTGDILELWPGAVALAWQETAGAYERRHPTTNAAPAAATRIAPNVTVSAAPHAVAPSTPSRSAAADATRAGAAGTAGRRTPITGNLATGAQGIYTATGEAGATRGMERARTAGDATLDAAISVAGGAVAVATATRRPTSSANPGNRADAAHMEAPDAASLQQTLRYQPSQPSPNGASHAGLSPRLANLAGGGNEVSSDPPQASGAGHGAEHVAGAPARTPASPTVRPVAKQPARQQQAAGANEDTLAQRLANLEQQIQALTQGLAQNGAMAVGQRIEQGIAQNLDKTPQGRALGADLQQAAGVVEQDLANPKTRRGLFANPRTLLRWALMILGLLFSDAIAWAITTFSQHPGAFPIPFLTVGTVFSGVLWVVAARLWI
ncbi:MAG TPA: N-acetylmuramoyl-L-alanine amidase [Ktedonobacterales bacterium]|nr:N-acetylmuramoyl-L-alanine amidase [Ktedonobacterales bacterium]